MKKLFLISVLIAFCATALQAQFYTPSSTLRPALSIPSGGYIHAKVHNATNIASPPACAVGDKGLSFYTEIISTNQLLTNTHIWVQFSADGVTWFGTNGNMNSNNSSIYRILDVPIHRVGANPLWTNLLTEAQCVGVRWARVKGMSNAGYLSGVLSNTLWVTNMYFITR